ncbi:uroporphyrinogen-III synthase [Epidermidibacterium keratini]|uniref:Uroporphyrinogen-III synthase n=1 Tax=Epidermidibacterium keratini TaxID=1891644 RepID=A0A7L4YQA5_9ACTN|nr:uroporphyrinogen-III synthase [Epidermidibacterium keratini]QHC01336.1 uroporphyrinogen-III synthase [Epidermidibacterium keratini]
MSVAPRIPADELAGTRVLITAQRRAGELGAALSRRGASVQISAVLSVIPHVDDHTLISATLDLIERPPDVVVITTGVGLRGWIEACDVAGIAPALLEVLAQARLIVRGPKARGAAQAAGLSADWVAESETSAEIRDLLLSEGVAGRRVAIQHHGAGSDDLDGTLSEAGADVQSLVVYRWGPPPDPAAVEDSVRQVARGEFDAVVFTAAPGTLAFIEIARQIGVLDDVLAQLQAPEGTVAAAVGPLTAAPLHDVAVAPLVRDRARLGALARALVRELAERRGLRLATCEGELRLLRSAAVLDERVLALSPSSLAVLRTLAAARGSVVTREQLLAVLPGDSADLHASEVAVARLRDSIGARGLVQTVVKRGYRLAVT